MNTRRLFVPLRGLVAATACAVMASSCATKPVVETPAVSLTGVQVERMDLEGQSFLLGFSISNPNPFPLPVKSVRYDLRLDNQTFASGTTSSGFRVAARGDGEFDIGVKLNLRQSMPQVAALLRGGLRDTVDYELHGSLDVDIPFARPIPFSSSGTVRLR